MAYSTHNWPDLWANCTWVVFVEGGGRWEFPTQNEAHVFMRSLEAYEPDIEIHWEVFPND